MSDNDPRSTLDMVRDLKESNSEMLTALKRIGAVLSTRKITTNDDELWAAFSQVIAVVAKANASQHEEA